MHNRLSRWALTGGAAVAALGMTLPAAPLATAQDAAAATHGNTRVAVARPVVELLTSAGITVAPTGAATAAAFRGTVAAKFPDDLGVRNHDDRAAGCAFQCEADVGRPELVDGGNGPVGEHLVLGHQGAVDVGEHESDLRFRHVRESKDGFCRALEDCMRTHASLGCAA